MSDEVRMVPLLPPTVTNVLFPKATLEVQSFAKGRVALSQVDPLSVDFTINPLLPTATNTSGFAEEELSDVLVELSEESSEESSEDEVVLSVLEVVAVLLSSDFAHEETSTAMMTINKNHDNKHFILFLIRKCCKIKPTHSQVTSIGLFYKKVGILLGGCLTGGQSDGASRQKCN